MIVSAQEIKLRMTDCLIAESLMMMGRKQSVILMLILFHMAGSRHADRLRLIKLLGSFNDNCTCDTGDAGNDRNPLITGCSPVNRLGSCNSSLAKYSAATYPRPPGKASDTASDITLLPESG